VARAAVAEAEEGATAAATVEVALGAGEVLDVVAVLELPDVLEAPCDPPLPGEPFDVPDPRLGEPADAV
jgi:hypothetical protein